MTGGRALLSAGGEVGESLFSASLGASSLHRLRERLDAEADALFPPRATSCLILQARARLDAAQSELRESTLRASIYIENERHLKATTSERRDLAERLRLARVEQNGRRRLRTLIPLLAEGERVQLELAGPCVRLLRERLAAYVGGGDPTAFPGLDAPRIE